MKKVFIYLLLFLNIVAAAALGIASVSVFLSPDKIWQAALFGMAYPYLLILNVVFIVIWIVVKPSFSFLSLLIILAGFNHIGNYLQFKGRETAEPGIKVISYNVRYFHGYDELNHKETADQILNFLRQKNADIICLQEVRLNKKQIFDFKNNTLTHIKHKQLAHTSNMGGPLTLTVFPILNMGEIRFKNSGNMIIYTDLLIETDTVRVYNCHLQSYRFVQPEIDAFDSLNFENHSRTKKNLKVLGTKYRDAIIKRAKQAATLKEHIDNCKYPVIVCGDFNDTPVSFTYRTVRGKLEDSFIQSGKGTANTYNGKMPSFRIDYIFHSPMYGSYNFEVKTLNHSDHYPVSCTLIKDKSLN